MASASAPASSGNIGPGFDTLALALELRCRVSATPANEWSADHVGNHCLPEGAIDGVLRAARAVVQQPLAMTVDNDIPLSRGLGSSSAALAAAAACALATVHGEVDTVVVFDLVGGFEGHDDNAAASVFGGLVAVDADGHPMSLEMHPDWVVTVAIPEYLLSTSQARDALPATVERSAVVRNLGRLVALTEGLRTGDPSLLARAAGDELHELSRGDLHPRASKLISAAIGAGAAHAAWSGAGPSVLALSDARTSRAVTDAMEVVLEGLGRVVQLDVAARGLIVEL